MLFIKISITTPLPGFKTALKISSPCMLKKFHINCMSEDVTFSVWEYLVFLCRWSDVKMVPSFESNASFILCGDNKASDFLSEFLSDFLSSDPEVFYLHDKKWRSLHIVKNIIECDRKVNFMIV